MKLSEIVAAFFDALPLGCVLEEAQVARTLKKTVRFYCGYATLTNAPSQAEIALAALTPDTLLPPEAGYQLGDAARAYFVRADAVSGKDVHSPISASNGISDDQDFDITDSEWSIMHPLFDLYIEQENSMGIEASRANGFESWGRSTSEIASDITLAENDLAGKAFFEEIITI